MLLFAITGITLNHAAQIEARPAVVEKQLVLPEDQRALITPADAADPSTAANSAQASDGKPVAASTVDANADASASADSAAAADTKRPLPPSVAKWLAHELSIASPDSDGEWSPEEIYVGLPRPGGDAWLSIDRESGEVTYERTDRGWVSYFNDLHKGRNTGAAWVWFLDLFAIAAIVFCVTGFFLLQFHSRARPATWPMVALGLAIPLVLAILFIH